MEKQVLESKKHYKKVNFNQSVINEVVFMLTEMLLKISKDKTKFSELMEYPIIKDKNNSSFATTRGENN